MNKVYAIFFELVVPKCIIAMKSKNRLYKKYLKNPNNDNERTYKTFRIKFNRIKIVEKKNYYQERIKQFQSDAKQTWKTINEIINPCIFENSFLDMIDDISYKLSCLFTLAMLDRILSLLRRLSSSLSIGYRLVI